MQYFIDAATGSPFAFEDNVIPVKGPDGTYTFTYTTGDRLPDSVTTATFAPATVDGEGNVVPGEMLTPESVVQGALVVYPVYAPGTLQPCTQDEFSEAQKPKPPTADEIVAQNATTQNNLLAAASVALAPLQTAVTLGIATDDETAEAKLWVAYVRSLKALDLTAASVSWPVAPD